MLRSRQWIFRAVIRYAESAFLDCFLAVVPSIRYLLSVIRSWHLSLVGTMRDVGLLIRLWNAQRKHSKRAVLQFFSIRRFTSILAGIIIFHIEILSDVIPFILISTLYLRLMTFSVSLALPFHNIERKRSHTSGCTWREPTKASNCNNGM